MIKKLVLVLTFFTLIILSGNLCYGQNCKLGGDVGSSIEGCLKSNTDVLQASNGGDLKITGGFKDLIVDFVKKISTFLAILAVGSIAYGSLIIVISAGEDDKIKKGKDIIKWSLIGFLALVSANGIIAMIVYFVYGLS